MLVRMADEMIGLTQQSERTELATEHDGTAMNVVEYLEAVVATLTEAVSREAWVEEGGWYARGTDGKGEWFGVPARAEGKIFLEPQPWAVMANVADPERAWAAMDSVYEKLFTPNGIQILTPACSLAPSGNFHVFPKGSKENGGIFCHPNPWAVCAETILGRGDRAFEYLQGHPAARSEREDRPTTAPSPTSTARSATAASTGSSARSPAPG